MYSSHKFAIIAVPSLALVFECGPQSRDQVTEKQLKMKLMMIHYEQRRTTQVGVKYNPNRSMYVTVTVMLESGSRPLHGTSLIYLVIRRYKIVDETD